MQTFSARKEGRAKVIYPYELALYATQGHEVWQDTPDEKRVARAGHPEDLVGIAFEDNSCTLKIGG